MTSSEKKGIRNDPLPKTIFELSVSKRPLNTKQFSTGQQ